MTGVEDVFGFLFAVIFMWLLTTFVYYQVFRNITISFFLSLFKYSICAVYFLVWSNYSPIILLDDQSYFENSLKVYTYLDGNIFKIFERDSVAYMGMLAGGFHFGYYIYIFISFLIFGPFYYSAVLLNIFLTSVVASMLFKTLKLAELDTNFIYFFTIFFSIHWDIITWSSFINLKDILVLFFTVWALKIFLELSFKRKYLAPLIKLTVIAFALFFLRFYLVYFLSITGLIYFIVIKLFKIRSRWLNYLTKPLLVIIMPIMFYLAFVKLFSSNLDDVGGTTNVILGFFRFLITPFPFSIEKDYSFLFFSAILHWLCLPFLIHGGVIFVKRYFNEFLPLLILTLLLCVFYGSFAELQGPRHRVLILYFIILLQALSIYEVLGLLIKKKS